MAQFAVATASKNGIEKCAADGKNVATEVGDGWYALDRQTDRQTGRRLVARLTPFRLLVAVFAALLIGIQSPRHQSMENRSS